MVTCVFVNIFVLDSAYAADVVSDVKANGPDGPVVISKGDNLAVAMSLDPGSHVGENADWWVVVETPFGWFHYDVPGNTWMPGLIVTHMGSLFELTPFVVLNTNGLPEGIYTFYFGVDMAMNGLLDIGVLFFDSVLVTITSNTNTFNLSVSKGGTGDGTVTSSDGGINCGSDCTESYAEGTTVILTALPDSGPTFNCWSGGGCNGTGSCVVTMNGATTVTGYV